MNWREIKNHYGYTVKALEKLTGVPRRTLEDWIAGRRTPPEYITKLLIEKLEGTLEGQKSIEEQKNNIEQKKKISIYEILNEIPYKNKNFEDWTLYDEIEDIQNELILINNHEDETPLKYIKRIAKLIDRIERIIE